MSGMGLGLDNYTKRQFWNLLDVLVFEISLTLKVLDGDLIGLLKERVREFARDRVWR